MDALSDVLRMVRLTGAVFLDARFSAPWCIGESSSLQACLEDMPAAQHVVAYHLVTEGTCEVALLDGVPRRVKANELIIIPGGEGHFLGNDLADPSTVRARFTLPRGPARSLQVRFGGGGAETRLVCGYLACDSGLFNSILGALPRLMVINMGDDPSGKWLASSLEFSLTEGAAPRAGASAMIAKLSELMFVEAIRRHIESMPPDQRGWLAGLRDQFVGTALALLHSQPDLPWTVEDLAKRVGLSRSALGERFSLLVGQPPMQYLMRWRLQLAADLLLSTQLTISAIASKVGYESEAAFSRAFKRDFGAAPATWRLRNSSESTGRGLSDQPQAVEGEA